MNRLYKTLAVVVALPFFVVGCCNGIDTPDDQLLVEISDAPTASSEEAAPNLCGAEVIAIADGETSSSGIPLEEVALDNADGSTRCAYRGTVDPDAVYTLRVKTADRDVDLDPAAVSNPACSVATDPDATDVVSALPTAPSTDPLAEAITGNVEQP